MTTPPATSPPPFTPDYATPTAPPSRGLALTAMNLGILSVPLICLLGAGFLVAIAALVVGIIALSRMSRDPLHNGGKGQALIGVVTACITLVAVPVLTVFSLMAPRGSRELANRAYCAANIRGILQSMIVYANGNSDTYPVLPPPAAPGTYAVFTTVAGESSADRTLSKMYRAATMNGDVTAAFWTLAMQERTTPKQFICKSDTFAGTPAPLINSSSNFVANFNGANVHRTLSYSLAYPYTRDNTVGAWWKNTSDSTLPLLSDMAPLQGTGSPATDVRRTTKDANSANHGRDGQVVGYGDAHSEWGKMPQVGQNGDNIFTTGGPGTGTPVAPGRIDVATFGSNAAAPFDVVMVPVRDLHDGTTR